ncbi:helix-turn-helix domain-containing protein [Mycolicibacterium parafortuitum]|uniref:DNA-binding protein [Clavibacter michiganensis subsp. sepedonicus] n=1 Tax=Mycolicibacterium parafortuitum TaxID=39692 RepID=A0A375YK62_MYCPF|nr:helix-turn-helix transcriptional regulator [Mycolicibacterium parafortuitum]SRX81547.1 DNA-binding protein [Clavibacter michiganensis subsp. sepedonicus] [Mycolicibacterium parafortuitum]
MGIDLFPGIDKPTSRDRLGMELADEQLGMIFGLRRVRVERGLSITEVAEAMGVDPAQVSRFESGSTNPTMTTIRRYAKAVGAVFRVETRSWQDEQTLMVQRSVEAWHSADDTQPADACDATEFQVLTSIGGR